MKKLGLIVLATLFISFNSYSQNMDNSDQKEIKKLVEAFEAGTAKRNLEALEKVLHQDYTVMVNRMGGKPGMTVINRETYLKLLEAEKIGGVSYEIDINQISVTGHTATVDLLFKSEAVPNMHKYIFVVQNDEDKWQVIADLPIFVK